MGRDVRKSVDYVCLSCGVLTPGCQLLHTSTPAVVCYCCRRQSALSTLKSCRITLTAVYKLSFSKWTRLKFEMLKRQMSNSKLCPACTAVVTPLRRAAPPLPPPLLR